MLQYHSDDGNGIRFFYGLGIQDARALPPRDHRHDVLWFLPWLAFANDDLWWTRFLAKPINPGRIQLPPFTGFWDTFDFGKSKVTFSTDLTDPNCLIMIFIKRYQVMYCRVGDLSWTTVYGHLNSVAELADATYCNGRFYFLYETKIKVIGPNKAVVIVLPQELRAVSKCFLEGKSGVYVLAIHPKGKFELYQFQEQTMQFKHITETSDNTAIFYGDCFPCFAVRSDDLDSLDGGSVYVEYQCIPYAWKRAVRRGYSKYSAKRAVGKEFVMCGLVNEPRFWPVEPAMWFQPSFH